MLSFIQIISWMNVTHGYENIAAFRLPSQSRVKCIDHNREHWAEHHSSYTIWQKKTCALWIISIHYKCLSIHWQNLLLKFWFYWAIQRIFDELFINAFFFSLAKTFSTWTQHSYYVNVSAIFFCWAKLSCSLTK